jgi:hypothetical protein
VDGMNQTRPIRLASDILSSVAILDRGSESVRAVMTSEDNRFSRALGDLQRLCYDEGIPIAIVGGLAAIRYGYPAATQDIDIAVAQSQLNALVMAAPAYGFKVAWEAKSGWHTLTHGDVEINVIPEGGKARNTAPTTIPGPIQLGVKQGLGYASLPGWIELKISSGRQKDRAHVVEVMKKSDLEDVRIARDHIEQVHQAYLVIFDDLLEEAEEERNQEKERGGFEQR